jgi:riboflavin synthase
MFTGIVEEVGQVAAIKQKSNQRRLTVSCPKLARGLKKGASVSVSGVCLTAVAIEKDSFSADLAQETWHRTSFSRLKPGALVNLELPMRASGRFDGHMVQGHVDGTGAIVAMTPIPRAKDYWLSLRVPAELTAYIVEKGSLAIEGISLTVAAIDGTTVGFAIIPHTAEVTNLRSLKTGDPVNLEVDVIAKYVKKILGQEKARKPLTVKSLKQQGF